MSDATALRPSMLHRFKVDFKLNTLCSFSCLDATATRVALGTSQGQVYVVERSVSKLGLVHGRLAATIQPCVDSDGIGAGATDLSVATVALCPDGTLVAIATRGNLQVFDVSTPSRPLYLAPSTEGAIVSCLAWNMGKEVLFSADSNGRVVAHTVRRPHAHAFVVANLGSPVVQMEAGLLQSQCVLLVSAADRCVRILHADVPGSAAIQQLGTKLRKKPLGACFYRPAVGLLAGQGALSTSTVHAPTADAVVAAAGGLHTTTTPPSSSLSPSPSPSASAPPTPAPSHVSASHSHSHSHSPPLPHAPLHAGPSTPSTSSTPSSPPQPPRRSVAVASRAGSGGSTGASTGTTGAGSGGSDTSMVTTARSVCCVRPGRRLWLADVAKGVVSSTLKFSAPFAASAFATGGDTTLFTSPTKPTFGKLLPAVLRTKHCQHATSDSQAVAGGSMPLLVSWDEHTLHVLDPVTILTSGGVVEWHVDLGHIISLSVCPAFPAPTGPVGAQSDAVAARGFSVIYVLHRRSQDPVPIVSLLSPMDALAAQAHSQALVRHAAAATASAPDPAHTRTRERPNRPPSSPPIVPACAASVSAQSLHHEGKGGSGGTSGARGHGNKPPFHPRPATSAPSAPSATSVTATSHPGRPAATTAAAAAASAPSPHASSAPRPMAPRAAHMHHTAAANSDADAAADAILLATNATDTSTAAVESAPPLPLVGGGGGDGGGGGSPQGPGFVVGLSSSPPAPLLAAATLTPGLRGTSRLLQTLVDRDNAGYADAPGDGQRMRRGSFATVSYGMDSDDDVGASDDGGGGWRGGGGGGSGGSGNKGGLSAEAVQAQHRQRLARAAGAGAGGGAGAGAGAGVPHPRLKADGITRLTRSTTQQFVSGHRGAPGASLGAARGRGVAPRFGPGDGDVLEGAAGMDAFKRRSGSVWSVSSSPAVLRSRSAPEATATVGHVHAFPLKNDRGETLYEIHLMVYLGDDNGVCACSNHTLREFLQLHAKLQKNKATRFKFDLPRPKWFGNQKASTIRYRAMRLDKYIKHALQIAAVVKHPAFADFVGITRAMELRASDGDHSETVDDARSVISSSRSVSGASLARGNKRGTHV